MSGLPQHFVSAAGAVFRDDGRVLAIRRDDDGTWGTPGGMVEHGEPPEATVCREVAEETGIVVRVTALTGVYPHCTGRRLAVVFRCVPVAGHPVPQAGEVTAVEWLTLDEARDRMPAAMWQRVADARELVPA